jgi:hypothetical protein
MNLRGMPAKLEIKLPHGNYKRLVQTVTVD